MNSFTQFVQHVKNANWSGANQVFADIMQQKVADRLAVEKRTVFEATTMKESAGPLSPKELRARFEAVDKAFTKWYTTSSLPPTWEKQLAWLKKTLIAQNLAKETYWAQAMRDFNVELDHIEKSLSTTYQYADSRKWKNQRKVFYDTLEWYYYNRY